MKAIFIAVVLFIASCGARALEMSVTSDGRTVITLSTAESVACNTGGGCYVVSDVVLRAAIRGVAENMCGREAKNGQ